MKKLMISALLSVLTAYSASVVKIVTTTPDLASIASSVGGSYVSVSSLVTGARDPHRIEAKPSYMSRVSSANLFLAIGLELEVGYEQAILDGSRNARVQPGATGHIYASDWVTVIDKPTGSVSRAMGDIHPDGNPHIWLDPYNGRVIAIRLADKLASIDPTNAKGYKSNLTAFLDRLDSAMFGAAVVDKLGGATLWDLQREGRLEAKVSQVGLTLGGWMKAMSGLKGTPIVTYHQSFNYFAKRFGLKVVDELEPKPGLDPSPGHLASVIRTVSSEGVKVIVQESFYSTKHAELVAARTGAKVVVFPQNVGHTSEAKDYISLFDTIVSRLAGSLR